MSLRGYTYGSNAVIITARVFLTTPFRARCLSHYTRRQQNAQQPENIPGAVQRATKAPPPPPPQQQQHDDEQSQQSRPAPGRRLPAFVAFLLAAPLGWYISNRVQQSSIGDGTADRTEFVPYTLVAKDAVSPTSTIFRLAPADPQRRLDLSAPALARTLTSVQFKQPQLQIARAYTPLPREPDKDKAASAQQHELSFLVRAAPCGEVSGFVHRLRAPGARIELRGPRAEYELPARVGQVAFVAGGTGIAPALQVAAVLAREDADAHVHAHVLWASRSRADCEGGVSDGLSRSGGWGLLGAAWRAYGQWGWGVAGVEAPELSLDSARKGEIVRRLNGLKELVDARGGALRVNYFVDEEGSFIRRADVQRALAPPPPPPQQQQHGSDVPSRKLLFVSGPDGFIRHWAGPKQWVNGREEQGPLGGILATLDLQGWEVVKL